MRQRNTTTWRYQDICKGIQRRSLWVFSTTQTFSRQTGHIFLSQPTDPSRNVVLGFGGGDRSIRNQLAFLCNSPPLLLSLAYPGAYPLEKTDELVKAVWGREDARASSHFSAEPVRGGGYGGKVVEKKDKKGWTLVLFHDISQWNVARPSTWVQKEPNHWHISWGPSFIQAAWIM